MQRKRKGNILLLGMTAMLAAMFLWVGCSGDTDEGGNNDAYKPISTLPPTQPRVTASQTGFEFIDSVDLKTVSEVDANNVDNQSAVVSLVWEGEGAVTYNVYWDEESARPSTPGLSGVTGTAAFARNLEPDTEYYFWVEAVNPNGNTFSDRLTKTTGKAGPQASGGMERGDIPKNIKVTPGSGSLTVSWSLSDRVGWYEVYYAPVGTIKHLDIYTPVEFKWDSSVEGLKAGAIDVSASAAAATTAYQATAETGTVGYTRPIYPYRTPLATNDGYTGYYVRDGNVNYTLAGDTRPVIGADSDYLDGGFYKIGEAYDKGIQDPYKPLDAAFARAIPWTGTANGTPGTPVKFFSTSTTITGLANGTTYEVWIRCPNTNGERAYSYAVGTPGGSTLGTPSNVQVSTPPNTGFNLSVSWNKVSGADNYRIYASQFDYAPNANTSYTLVDGEENEVILLNLQNDTTYYVWVVAEKDGLPGAFSSKPVSGRTGSTLATGHTGDKIIAGTNEKVKTAVYIEVNDRNPLNAGSYVLDDGTYLFDYVILFAANIRNRDCALESDNACTESGPHVHFNPNVKHILDNRNKYIKPLQDKGIKVLLGLLGDHDGIGFGSMNDVDRATFIANMKQDVEDYGLDGVDFDDEWGSKEDWDGWSNNYGTISPNSIWTYPTSTWGYPTSVTVYRDPSKAIIAGNGQLSAPSDADMTRMWRESGESYYKTIEAARTALGPNKIVTLYEYNTGRYVTPSGEDNGTATRAGLEGLIDFALQPWYNQYLANSINGLPNSIYSPFGMDLSGKAYSAQNGAPNPPIVVNGNSQATNTVYDYATRFKNQATAEGGAYNMLYFYGLEESTNLLKHVSTDSRATITKEEYISMMSDIVFGKKVLITSEGERGDYRKDW